MGKSIISNELRQTYAVSVVSTDTLCAVMEKVLSPEVAPDLFVFETFNQMPVAERVNLLMTNPPIVIEYIRRESHIVWTAVEAFIKRENDEGRDVLIEGAAVLPELVAQIHGIPHKVVFIGNQSDNHKGNLKRSVIENEHDWMRGANDQYIDAFAAFVQQMSIFIEQEAKKYGFEYIGTDKQRIVEVTEEVKKALGLSIR